MEIKLEARMVGLLPLVGGNYSLNCKITESQLAKTLRLMFKIKLKVKITARQFYLYKTICVLLFSFVFVWHKNLPKMSSKILKEIKTIKILVANLQQ